jgi:HK97 family phage major capsid protein
MAAPRLSHRAVELAPSPIAAGAGSDALILPATLATSRPVRMPDGVLEVLLCREQNVDLSRVTPDGLPLLEHHDLTRPVGAVRAIKPIGDRVRGTVHVAAGDATRELRTQLRERSIPWALSIGYALEQWELREQDGEVVRVVTKWTLYETSLVPVPADSGAGFDRSADPALSYRAVPAPDPSDIPTNMTDTPDVFPERQRAADLLALGQHMGAPTPAIAQAIEAGLTPAQFLRRLDAARAATEVPTPTPRDDVHVTRDEADFLPGYVARAFRDPTAEEVQAQSRAYARRAGLPTPRGVVIPLQALRALGKGADPGQQLFYTQSGDALEALRAYLIHEQATQVSLAGGGMRIPRITAGVSATIIAENSGSVSPADPAMAEATLTGYLYAAATNVSVQLAKQAQPDAQQMVLRDLARAIMERFNRDLITGTGSGQPRGILQTAGIGAVAVGTNGGPPTWDHLVNLETEVTQDNADIGAMAYLTTPQVFGRLKRTQKFNTTTGMPILDGESANGYRVLRSTTVPSTLTKGTSSGVCHAMIFGVWSELVVGTAGALDLIVDQYSLARNGQLALTAHLLADGVVRRPEAFAAVQDFLPNA